MRRSLAGGQSAVSRSGDLRLVQAYPGTLQVPRAGTLSLEQEACTLMTKMGRRIPAHFCHRMVILICHNGNSVDDRVQGLDRGVDDYLVKPFVIRMSLLDGAEI
jgi:hypothetical protein